jgi:DNA-directed RNA polymerase subunit M/transcription elongation factor TFIIS
MENEKIQEIDPPSEVVNVPKDDTVSPALTDGESVVRTCPKCGVTKTTFDFWKNCRVCKSCSSAEHKAWRKVYKIEREKRNVNSKKTTKKR